MSGVDANTDIPTFLNSSLLQNCSLVSLGWQDSCAVFPDTFTHTIVQLN